MKANRQILALLLFMIISVSTYAQVIITANPTDVADTSAMLEVRSSDRGFLPPRMTAEQRDAIVLPASGLIVFCTNCGDYGVLQLRNNYAWVDILTGPLSEVNYAPVASNVQISGNPIAGQTLTGSYQYSDAENNNEGFSIYKWYRADNSEGLNETLIPNATGLSYTTGVDDFLKYVRFSVTPIASIGTNPGLEVKSSWSTQILAGAPEALNVTQTGNITVGSLLTGEYEYFNGQGTPEGSSMYKWYRADDELGTNEVYVGDLLSPLKYLDGDDYGKYIRFSVTPISQDPQQSIGTEVKSSTFIGPVEHNRAPVASSVTQTGSAINGSTLVGEYSYSDFENDSEASTFIKWYMASDDLGTGEELISGANSLTYTLQATNIGKYVRMSITPIAQTGTSTGDEVFASTYIGPVLNALPEARNVMINGNVSTGSTVTVTYDYFDLEGDAQNNVVYKWYRSDNDSGLNETLIEGVTGNSYLLGENDLRRFIRASVTVGASSGRSPSEESFSQFHGSIVFLVECGVQVLTSTLNVGVMIPASQEQSNNNIVEKYCYNDSEENCLIYGGFYTWGEAMKYTPSTNNVPGTSQGVCPDGYHIPSDLEFSQYEHCVETNFEPIGSVSLSVFQNNNGGRGTNLATKLKSSSPMWNGTNISGFSSLPSGFRHPAGNTRSIGTQSYIWTSTEANSIYARIRLFQSASPDSQRRSGEKTYGLSVRCFKD